MDAYWVKDIQELFRLERRHSFQRFAELLMAQSGNLRMKRLLKEHKHALSYDKTFSNNFSFLPMLPSSSNLTLSFSSS